MSKKIFKTRDELNAEICRRAHAIFGMRGYTKPNKIRLNTTPLRDRIPLEVTDDQLAQAAVRVVDETLYYTIEYI